MTSDAQVFVDSHEHGSVRAMAELILNAEIKTLSEGDFWVIGTGFDKQPLTVKVERKTWSDAYGSFNSKRLQEQVSRLIESAADTSGVRTVLLIEGSPRDIYGVSPDRIRSLQQHLNRLSVESLPVVYTESMDETFRYLNSVIARVKAGEFGSLVRPVTVVSSTRNKHHALLEQIPKVGRTTGKKIYNHFDSLADFVIAFESNPPAGIKPDSVAYQTILNFITESWLAQNSETIAQRG
ncbi:hypothetical protein N9M03_00235 [bacterium]|nr:hypothetical protein [bacterium]